MKSKFKEQVKTGRKVFLTLLIIMAAACSKEENPGPGGEPEPPVGTAPATILECNYDDLALVNNPEAPVDYVVECTLYINGDLTIEPGTVIMFSEGAGLDIESNGASIVAEGTADLPIVFTGEEQQKGYWGYINIDTKDPKNSMKHCIIEYAGGDEYRGNLTSVVVDGVTEIKIENSTIRNGDGFGLFIATSKTKVTLANNTITNNEYPLRIEPESTDVPSITDDYTGNVNDYILVDERDIVVETRWKKANVPYVVHGGSIAIYNAPLIIEPGTVIEMGPGTSFSVDGGNPSGALKIVGTPTDPIIIRGELDGPGSWKGINYSGQHPLNEIGYAVISEAGQPDIPGAISMWFKGKLNIHDTTIKNVAAPAWPIYGEIYDAEGINPNFSSSNLTFENVPCEIYWN